MEEEWRSVDVGYPQYVYTVSGWIQVVEVQTYSAKPALRVIVVPHSHQDVGELSLLVSIKLHLLHSATGF